MNKIDIVPKELDADGKALTFQEVEGFLKETEGKMRARVKNLGMDDVVKTIMMLIILCQKIWNEKEELGDKYIELYEAYKAIITQLDETEEINVHGREEDGE
jgi:hypothetical protein